jgi:hypothetical protein
MREIIITDRATCTLENTTMKEITGKSLGRRLCSSRGGEVKDACTTGGKLWQK